MGNHLVSAGNNSKKLELADEERQEVAVADICVKKPSVVTTIESQRPRRRMHRVPPQVRENKAHVYDPVIISVGPYHQGQPHLLQAEKIKDDILNSTFSTKDKDMFHDKVLENLDEIRSLYEGVEFNDTEAWTELLIRDACFVLYYMKAFESGKDDIHLLDRLGHSRAAFLFRDLFMIENQIPVWVLKQLVGLIYDKEEGEALFCNFLSRMNFGEHRLSQLPWEDDEEQEPLHLLEAHRMTLLKDEKSADHESNSSAQRHHFVRTSLLRWMRRKPISHCQFEWWSSPFHSVTDLKAKGIYFSPSSNCLTDIRFDSYSFYGKLELPIWFVTNNTSVFFSNIIAFEMSPETNTDCAVTSYVNFMKSLIDNTKDVKELREKGILFSRLANDEEVVKVFKEIETYGAGVDTFLDVKARIEEHCNSKLKTWMAELIHTYFHTPWTVIALFAASLLLCLTFLQTFFTIRSPMKH